MGAIPPRQTFRSCAKIAFSCWRRIWRRNYRYLGNGRTRHRPQQKGPFHLGSFSHLGAWGLSRHQRADAQAHRRSAVLLRQGPVYVSFSRCSVAGTESRDAGDHSGRPALPARQYGKRIHDSPRRARRIRRQSKVQRGGKEVGHGDFAKKNLDKIKAPAEKRRRHVPNRNCHTAT